MDFKAHPEQKPDDEFEQIHGSMYKEKIEAQQANIGKTLKTKKKSKKIKEIKRAITEYALENRSVKNVKQVTCFNYEHCLSHAVNQNWESWRCPLNCKGFSKKNIKSEKI